MEYIRGDFLLPAPAMTNKIVRLGVARVNGGRSYFHGRGRARTSVYYLPCERSCGMCVCMRFGADARLQGLFVGGPYVCACGKFFTSGCLILGCLRRGIILIIARDSCVVIMENRGLFVESMR